MTHDVSFFISKVRKLNWTFSQEWNIYDSIWFSSVIQLCPTLCHPMDCSTPGLPVHHQLPELAQTQSNQLVMPSNHLNLCCPLLLPPSIFPSIRVFSNESVLHIKWRKYWSFSFSISPSNKYSGLTSFRIDWLDLLAVKGTLKSLLQHHQFCSTQLSLESNSHIHTYWKNCIALTRRTFVGKGLCFIMSYLVWS